MSEGSQCEAFCRVVVARRVCHRSQLEVSHQSFQTQCLMEPFKSSKCKLVHGSQDEPVPSTSGQTFHSLVPPIQPAPLAYPTYPNILSVVPSHWLHSKEDFPGIYGFHLGFEEERLPVVRASPWTYSPTLKKLYGKNRVDIPVRIFLNAPPELCHQLQLRIVVMFSKANHSRSVVCRCRNHESSDGRKHILESCNSDAVYGTDQNEGHHWVILPIRNPEVGQQYILEFLRFICLNTCPGGPDRRSFHGVFLLEQDGNLIARQRLDLKISTTPGRDRPKEERKFTAQQRPSQLMRKVKQEPTVHQERSQPSIAVKTEDEENQIFTIQIRGRKRYEELLRLKEALEIRDLVDSSSLANYRANCPPSGPNWLLRQQSEQLNSSYIQETMTNSTNGPSTSGFSQGRECTRGRQRFLHKRHRSDIATTSTATTTTVPLSDSSD